jgi:MoxR-like ATPase
LEGPPGVAKTLVARTIAHAVGLGFKRVQMTPDLMPSDLLGVSVWRPHEARFEFRPGPMFTDVLLADELNRAPPKTQAALLEAMQERRVTVDGESRPLHDGFWVLATQNPLEQEGTYPLPESQLDRFSIKLSLSYPSARDELELLHRHRDRGDALAHVEDDAPVLDQATLNAWQQRVTGVHVDDAVVDYLQKITGATRDQADLAWGAGPRAAISLLTCGRSLALVRGRHYVIPDDIRDLVLPVLGHRLRLAPEAQIAGVDIPAVVERILSGVPVPTTHAEPARGTSAAPL